MRPQLPHVSIVTPVYNGEAYLRQCIESVLAQSHRAWDHVIVDNRSTDATVAIAEEYAARDPRIRVHRNERFVRVQANHNIALRLISPESTYCKVLAADDWLYPDCLEKMVALAEAHPTVAIVQAYRHQGTRVAGDGIPVEMTVLRGRDACRLWLLPDRPSIFGAPTSLLYRSAVVRERPVFFNESNIHADTEACLEILASHDYGFVHQVLTYQRIRRGSIMTEMDRLRTDFPARLYELVTYGPRYLAADELAAATEALERDYYRMLGRQLLARPGRAFWDLHRSKRASLGYSTSSWRVLTNAGRYLIGLAIDPGSTSAKLRRRVGT